MISVLRAYYLPPAAAKEKKNVWGHPTPRQRTLSSALLCSAIIMPLHLVYTFLNVQVTLPKESLSPSLTGAALSGSRRLPLMRVEFVLFRSVIV